MTVYLLDADISVFAMQGQPAVEARIAATAPGRLVLSTLVYSQLLQGIPGRPQPALERELIAVFVAPLILAAYDREAAAAYGRIIAAIGHNRRQAVDRMIAAHALSLDATLVTNNTADFAAIPDLRVENWAVAA